MGATVAMQPDSGPSPLLKALGAIALVLLTAVATYLVTARLNVETALQQQQSAAISQFEESGAQMDSALSEFIDAVLDKREVTEARSVARTAITLHASRSAMLRPLVGSGNLDQYVNGLGDLRELVDATDGKVTGRSMAQQHVNLMAYREELVSLARSRVYQ